MSRLTELRRPFREDYLDYETLTAQLKAWADAFGDIAHLESIGKSGEGRELWVLTIGFDPERPRPAAWIDGNMHASELAGSSVALAAAEAILAVHLGESDLPEPMRRVITETLVHVMPRMSPDGAEAVLKTRRYVRSVPRDDRPKTGAPRWEASDVDGDGVALLMRVEDSGGEFVEAPEFPGLLVPRELHDEGPFYKLYPEGTIDGWDGVTVPDPSFLSDNDPDLNRNFPATWEPDHIQMGAGRYPMSEPESRAVVEYTAARPHLFAWTNLHTFGGVFIRPLGDAPDAKMNPFDRGVYKLLEGWADELTGYPTVSGFEEFTYEPGKRLHGDMIDYAFVNRGCIAWVCELWDIFEQVGFERPKRFVERYSRLDRADLIALAEWDRDHNQGRVVRPWRAFDHPQLGPVELGGLDPTVGFSNPPNEKLPEVCDQQAELFSRMVALAPRIVVADVQVKPLGDGIRRVSVTVENQGYLPSQVLESARGLTWNQGLVVDAEPVGGELVDPNGSREQLGHLDGWGRGRHSGFGAIYFQRSKGTGHRAVAHFDVRGGQALKLQVWSPRTGRLDHFVELEG
ncbi:MAG: peptidase M14 [Deltaproteobacteria bacterium]|nr:peptidase M14 [Deltaproteobacteria bacterium]